jgi:hypothetical protein
MEPFGTREIDSLILRALVRHLVAKDLLSEDDVGALLLEAVNGVDAEGGTLSTQAAQDIVREQLAPAFLGR